LTELVLNDAPQRSDAGRTHHEPLTRESHSRVRGNVRQEAGPAGGKQADRLVAKASKRKEMTLRESGSSH
jgi:hypothetical protein